MVLTLKHYPPIAASVWPKTDTLVLAAFPASAQLARLHVSRTLMSWGIPGLAEDARIVTSELVTNALKASYGFSGVVKLYLWANKQALLIETWDASPEMPAVVTEPDGEYGRGLAIVAALSAGFGWYPDSAGKVVWASLRG